MSSAVIFTVISLFITPRYGFIGVAWSMNLTLVSINIILFAYIKISKRVGKTWIPWTMEAFSNWKKYLDTSVPITGIILA